jgi:DNA polymerase-3 subunit epsilon
MLKNIVLERPLAVIDLAATGVDTKTDRIIEVRILRLRPGGAHKHRIRRVNPGVPIPREATAVHEISDDEVADLPTFGAIAPGLARFLDGCDLCGFNILTYDLRLLAAECKRAGVRFPIFGRKIVDVCQILNKLETRDPNVYGFYCRMPAWEANNTAMDVLTTLSILDDVVSRHDLPRTVDGLHAYFKPPNALDTSGLFGTDQDGSIVFIGGRYKGRSLADIARTEPGYLRWVVREDLYYEDAREIASAALEQAWPIDGGSLTQGLVGR